MQRRSSRSEFGHGMGLRHVLNLNDLLYPTTGPDTCKVIHVDDVNGGLYELLNVAPYLGVGVCYTPNPQFRSLPVCSGGTSGIAELGVNSYNIIAYPNPFDQTITINADIDYGSEMKIELIDILGEPIVSYDCGSILNRQFEKTISTAGLSGGVYLLKVSINNTATVLKLVKNQILTLKNKIMKIIIKILFLQSLVFLCGNCHSQQIPLVDTIGDHFHWTLADKVKKSDAVIEGRVINQFSQWTEGFLGPKGNVFTSVIIRVSRIFKGQVNDTIIEVIINGGVYPSGSRKGQRSRSDYGWIFPGYEGLFFLRSNNTDIQSGKNLQSFFYLRFESTAIGYTANPLNSPYPEAYYEGKMISDFENILYKPIEAITGTPAKVIGLNSYEAAAKKQQR